MSRQRRKSTHPSRRSVIGGLGLTAALGLTQTQRAAAETTDLSSHPLTGTWLGMASPPLPEDSQVASPVLFAADGTVLLLFPVSQRSPQGPIVNSRYVGVWEPDSDRRGHFTAVQSLSTADGTFLGTITVDGFPKGSDATPSGERLGAQIPWSSAFGQTALAQLLSAMSFNTIMKGSDR